MTRSLPVLLVLLLSTLCRADGFIIIPQPTPVPAGHFTFAPLEVSYHHVTVDIKDQVAQAAEEKNQKKPQAL